MISLKVEHLTRFYGRHKALDDLSFTVRAGSIHALLGPNGAGKTTTLRVIAGLIQKDHGTLSAKSGERVLPQAEFQRSVGYLPDSPPLYLNMKVAELLDFVGEINDLPIAASRSIKDFVVTELELGGHLDKWVGHLSRGYQQRVALAQCLMSDPQLLILDEPTLGLDPVSIKAMRNFIVSLSKKKTIIVSSHLLHEVQLIAEDLTIIKDGKSMFTGSLTSALDQHSPKRLIRVRLKKWITGFGERFPLGFSVVRKQQNESEIVLDIAQDTDSADISILSKLLVDNNLGLLDFHSEVGELEEAFFNLTENHL